MVTFITHKFLDTKEIKILNQEEGKIEIHKYYNEKRSNNNNYIAIDLETNGLDAYENKPILIAIGDKNNKFIIDCTSVDVLELLPKQQFTYIGHNIKFDLKFMLVHYNMKLIKTYDVMLGAQKIYQGAGYHPKDNPIGLKFNLVSIIEKFLKIDPGMDKEIRNEFVNIDISTYSPKIHHILYAAKDIEYLEDLMIIEKEILRKKNIHYMNNIGKYLPYSIGKLELNGFNLNVTKFRNLIKEKIKEKKELELKLDVEFKKLRANNKNAPYVSNGKYDRIRNQTEVVQTSLWEDDKIKKEEIKLAYVNWQSTDQIQKIFSILGLEMPVEDKNAISSIPKFYIYKNKQEENKIKVLKDKKYTTKADNIKMFLSEKEEIITKDFFNYLITYRELNTSINTFGENFIEKLNSVTNKIHSIFRIDTSSTGRLQSGERNTKYPNFQNIPRDNRYRTCFSGEENESVITSDLSGAEVTIMCDFANDEQLYEWAVKQDDAHSPIATACWRNVFIYRQMIKSKFIKNEYEFFHNKERFLSSIDPSKVKEGTDLYNGLNFTITKEHNKEYRQQFKNVTFAVVYNVGIKKVAKMLQITIPESYIVINTIKRTIPKTFRMVEEASKNALTYGSVRINERSGNRILFMLIIDTLKKGENVEDLDYSVLNSIEGASRNVRIQGTQADMLKEAIVEITLHSEEYNLPFRILNNVHDELVIAYPTELIEQKNIIWFNDDFKKSVGIELFLPVNKKLIEKAVLDSEYELLTAPEYVQKVMITAASRYLKSIKWEVV